MSNDASAHAQRTSLEYNQFVPLGKASLIEDAPGWAPDGLSDIPPSLNREPVHAAAPKTEGPICWKCHGEGFRSLTRRENGIEKTIKKPCTVCHERGRLPPKQSEVRGKTQPGKITRTRKAPLGWNAAGPAAYAISCKDVWSDLLLPTLEGKDVILTDDATEKMIADSNTPRPAWLPQEGGEELCNLVGNWRILQRVGSHRWTTDDLVTAWVAIREAKIWNNQEESEKAPQSIRYLDLGTGNASVLQMTTWGILKNQLPLQQALGIEARQEAVGLARRSLAFNMGATNPIAQIKHADFRSALEEDPSLAGSFDLVTGTPPYFRVDFKVQSNGERVEKAIIRQGGMPTAMQSAPARCEFRGGIEAYCNAARQALSSEGHFIVCENWLNHERVLQSATSAGLCVLKQLRVEGREGKGPLFCVYVMCVAPTLPKESHEEYTADCHVEFLAVRDCKGDWTDKYKATLLKEMSIPS